MSRFRDFRNYQEHAGTKPCPQDWCDESPWCETCGGEGEVNRDVTDYIEDGIQTAQQWADYLGCSRFGYYKEFLQFLKQQGLSRAKHAKTISTACRERTGSNQSRAHGHCQAAN